MTPPDRKIAALIGSTGPIPFSRFMEIALYDPDGGYYRGDTPPIGASGDFYTSPCVHPVFGACIANLGAAIADRIGGDGTFTFVEGGAGSGILARDIGHWLRTRRSDLHSRSELIIIEPHDAYRRVQRETIGDAFDRVRHVGGPDELPVFDGLFYSNELFDAFPVEIVERRDGEVHQIHVDLRDGMFVETQRQPDPTVTAFMERNGIVLPDDHRTELCPAMASWYTTLLGRTGRGGALTIDYGYGRTELLAPEHNRGTLMSYHRHRATEDVLQHPGEQDMTAHVDFTLLRDTGTAAGCDTAGFTQQQYFLMSGGFAEEVEDLYRSVPFDEYQRQVLQVKRLIDPSTMGAMFKVLCQTKGIDTAGLPGFTMRSRLKEL